MRPEWKGYMSVFLAAFFWGIQGTLGKLFMIGGIHPVTIAAIRILSAALLFLLVILLSDPRSLRISGKGLRYFLLFGTGTIGVIQFSFHYAIYYTGVATASVLLYTAPAFVTLLSLFLFREIPTTRRLLALGLTISGCLAILRASAELDFHPAGVLFGVLAGFTFALWTVLGKRSLSTYGANIINFFTLLIGGLALLGAAAATGGPAALRVSPAVLGGLFLMGLFTTFLPNNFYIRGMRTISASKASILANSELAIAVLLSYLVFQEPFSFFKTLGFCAIVGGLLLIAREDLRQARASLSPPERSP